MTHTLDVKLKSNSAWEISVSCSSSNWRISRMSGVLDEFEWRNSVETLERRARVHAKVVRCGLDEWLRTPPLIVGLTTSWCHLGGPLVGPGTGSRLDQLLGPFAHAPDRENLVAGPYGIAARRADLTLTGLRLAARRFDVSDRPFVVLLGRDVARGFDVEPTFLTWQTLRRVPAAVIPHPSGRNRWWNDQAKTEQVRQFLAAAFTTWSASNSLI